MPALALLLSIIALASTGASDSKNTARLAQAAAAYRRADFATCASLAARLERADLRNPDVAALLAGQCRFYAGEPGAALKHFERLAHSYPDSPYARLAALRAADCLWELDRRSEAIAGYARADDGHPDPIADLAVGLARRARASLEAGQIQPGQRSWIELRRRFPRHPLARPAPPAWPALQLGLGDGLTLVRSLHQARQWERALALVDSLPDPADPQRRFEMAFLAGRILFDMRFHYDQAAHLLQAARDHASGAPQAEEAWFYASRSLGRADRDVAAVASHLAMVQRYPGGEFAAQALFYAGWLEQNQGHCERALPLFERVTREYPATRWNREAAWFAAWCHLRGREWQAAIDRLAPQLRWRGYESGGRARYWTGVALLELGQPDQARVQFLRIVQEHPLTWYSRLARLRLGSAAPPWPPTPPSPEDSTALEDPLLSQAQELIAADLGELASRLLRQQERRFLARHPGRAGLLSLLSAYRQAQDFHRPWYLALVRERSALRALPAPETRALWFHAYPACERNRLERQAGGDGAAVLLLQAIMRTESGFAPQALSVADARGLMQMIPPTAARVATELGLSDYTDDALFDPEINIRTAAYYILGLVHKFKRQWPLAAAAYNAGPLPMIEWCRDHGDLAMDAFVETIPFTETRNYAKRVFTAMTRYAWLEGAELPELRLELAPQPLAAGPDY